MGLVTNVAQTNLPGRYAFIDNSKAVQATAGTSYNLLIFGTASAGSPGPVNEAVQIFGETDGQQWGEGGMLDREVTLARRANPNSTIHAIALAEGPGGTKATQTITIPVGTATENGTLHAYIGGQYTPVPVPEGADEDDIAIALNAAVAAKASLTLESAGAAVANVVSLRTKFAGEAGGSTSTPDGSIQIQFNRGIKEKFPAGTSAPVIVYAAGTGDPDVTPGVASMVDVQYTHICFPYEGSANQDVLKDELEERFGPDDQKWGVSITCKIDTTANLLVYGLSRNSQVQATPAMDPGTASPLFECTAVASAVVTAEADPARPWQTLPLPGIVGAKNGVGQQRGRQERNALLGGGISTTTVSPGVGTVQIERVVTNYRVNPSNAPDTSYKNLNTVLQVLVFRDAINQHFALHFNRHKLAGDGNDVGSGQAVMTPTLAKTEILSIFRLFVEAGIMEDFEQFKRDLIVERSDLDEDRLEYSCNPNTVNQFRVFAGSIAFLK